VIGRNRRPAAARIPDIGHANHGENDAQGTMLGDHKKQTKQPSRKQADQKHDSERSGHVTKRIVRWRWLDLHLP